MKLVFDIEANGFYAQADTIWCIVTVDIETEVYLQFTPDCIESGLALLLQAEEITGHNIIDYDLPLIKKLYHNFNYIGNVFDTMIMSQLLFPERPGGHSLASFGKSLGIQKPEHEDFSKYTPEMLHRCTEDVRINLAVYKQLQKEAYEPIEGVQYGL